MLLRLRHGTKTRNARFYGVHLIGLALAVVAGDFPDCDLTECHAGLECGYCLRLLKLDECPRSVKDVTNGGLQPCEPDMVEYGQMCEADGPCGTSNRVNNCNYMAPWSGSIDTLDFYLRVACVLPPSPPPRPPSPPALPPPPPRPRLPDCGVCDAGHECGYCLRLLRKEECPKAMQSLRLANCEPGSVNIGETCEGDGQCGTDNNFDNCGAQG